MCKEDGQYEVKGNDHIRHIDKTRQDHMPVSERPRVMAAKRRRAMDKVAAEIATPEFEASLSAVDGLILTSMQGNL